MQRRLASPPDTPKFCQSSQACLVNLRCISTVGLSCSLRCCWSPAYPSPEVAAHHSRRRCASCGHVTLRDSSFQMLRALYGRTPAFAAVQSPARSTASAEVPYRALSGQVPAHAVWASAGRCRGGTKVHPWHTSAVRGDERIDCAPQALGQIAPRSIATRRANCA